MTRISIYNKYYFFFTLVFCGITLQTVAQESQHSETEKKVTNSFYIEPNGEFRIDNKYGFVQCNTWEKDSIKVFTEIEVLSKEAEESEKLMNSIDFQFTNTSNLVFVETEINSDKKKFIQNYLREINVFDNTKIMVNHTVWLPASVDLNIKNKFGDVLLEEHSGRNTIELNHGNLRFEKFTQKCNLDLSFGKLIGRSIEDGSIDLKNVEVKLKKVNSVNLKSSGSQVEIDDIETLNINSVRDDFSIEKIQSLKGSSKFSDIEIEELSGLIELAMENGDLEIEEINEFSLIDIGQKSSHIDVNISDTSFTLNAELERTDLSVPRSVSNVSKTMIDEKMEHRKVSLNYGDSPDSQIILRGKRGSFTFWD